MYNDSIQIQNVIILLLKLNKPTIKNIKYFLGYISNKIKDVIASSKNIKLMIKMKPNGL